MPSDTETADPVIRLAQKGRWMEADTETPVSLFLHLTATADDTHEQGILLESAEVDGRWGRYSVLATDFLLLLHCRGGKLAVTVNDPRLEAVKACEGLPFLDGVQAVMRQIAIEPETGFTTLPAITRALYGYLGYGIAGLCLAKLEKVLPPDQAESCLVLPGKVMLFDHLYNRLCELTLRDTPARAPVARPPAHAPETTVGAIRSYPEQAGYVAQAEKIKGMLRQGEAIQIVLSTRFEAPYTGDAFTFYRRLRRFNPSPYMFFMRLPGMELVGSSPELLVRCTAGQLQLNPIAGTRKRGKTDEEDAALAADLLQDPKERAEHVMLVDLGRNDLGRIAKPGSVKVERLMEVERFSHVMHLTSRVTAQIDPALDAMDVIRATFPAGTVSGAPKVRAMEIIAETEPLPRGPYAGAAGWFGLDRGAVNLDTGIIIRSLWAQDGMLRWQAGAGIVYDSVPESEWQECCNKSAVMRAVVNGEKHVPAHR